MIWCVALVLITSLIKARFHVVASVRNRCSTADRVVIFGSFFTVAEAMALFKRIIPLKMPGASGFMNPILRQRLVGTLVLVALVLCSGPSFCHAGSARPHFCATDDRQA
ncbi:MAG: hypothetical protein CM15mP84_09030 [Cellvibrionales bacterium]|nr:MAG: hypothetical protein CM15mP84_09030 [Cellvibrionales bacterium]